MRLILLLLVSWHSLSPHWQSAISAVSLPVLPRAMATALAADYGDLPRRTYVCKIVLIKRNHDIYLDIQIGKHQSDNQIYQAD
jgi:hypothetical protein